MDIHLLCPQCHGAAKPLFGTTKAFCPRCTTYFQPLIGLVAGVADSNLKATERAHAMLLDACRWIPVSEKRPTVEDSLMDPANRAQGEIVLVLSPSLGIDYRHYADLGDAILWTRIPALPKKEPVKWAAERKAFAEGKTIEWRSQSSQWCAWNRKADSSEPAWDNPNYEYRIASLTLAQDPHGRPLHNPDQLSGIGSDELWKLLTWRSP